MASHSEYYGVLSYYSLQYHLLTFFVGWQVTRNTSEFFYTTVYYITYLYSLSVAKSLGILPISFILQFSISLTKILCRLESHSEYYRVLSYYSLLYHLLIFSVRWQVIRNTMEFFRTTVYYIKACICIKVAFTHPTYLARLLLNRCYYDKETNDDKFL